MNSALHDIPWPAIRLAAILLGLLTIGSLIVTLMKWRHPEKDTRELAARTRSWWFMVAFIFACALLPQGWALTLLGLLSFWAFKEFITLLPTRPADHKALAVAILAVPVQMLFIHHGWYGMFLSFIPVYMFLLLPAILVQAGETRGFVASAARLQWGLMAFVYGLSHLAALRVPALSPIPAGSATGGAPGAADGRTLLLFLIFTVEMSDVLQYVWGKLLGRKKIIPAVSPNKTWAGFIGGVLTASLLAASIRFLTPFSSRGAIAIALAATIAGFVGGAVMSAVKRDFGVKDFGDMIPGHGGVLDRVDSLCYAAPLFYHLVRYFYLP